MSATTAPEIIRSRLDTSDPEIAHQFITDTYANHSPQLSGDREHFQFGASVVQESRFGIERLRHSMSLTTDVDPYGSFMALHVRRGVLQMQTRELEVITRAGEVMMAGATEGHHAFWNEMDMAIVRLDVDAMQQTAAELTGTPPGRIHFELSAALDQPRAAHWLGTVNYVQTSVLDAPLVADNPLIRGQAFRMLVTAALNTFPNSTMRGDFSGQAATFAPTAVARAIDFIKTHADRDITVTDIAVAAAVSPRTIQLAFRRHCDTTPMAYVRRVRLQEAHAELRAADPTSTTVTAVANRWGFLHAGYFARVYQQEYDCLPQDTLRS